MFSPSSINKSAHLFLQMVSNDILTLPFTPMKSSNLTPLQKHALSNIKSYTHLTIKEANKGSCIVVMNNAQYKRMCLDILDIPLWYYPLHFEELDSFTIEFYELINMAYYNGNIDNKVWKFIRTHKIEKGYCV